MGGTISNGKDNDELIDILIEADYLKTPSLQKVFRAVDRGNYYTESQRKEAYRDAAWRSGNLHLSAPCVYSEVMEALKLKTGQSFLNLGSGSGYLSTLAGLVLGPYGTNHGVEYYSDVVNFANGRLIDFISESEAIDAFEFCVPNFLVGNCLQIDNTQLYDRVYCGASCPGEHETYMKHLIKIGGILVMPFNNKLLQITRTSETTWKSVKVLSVSFAPLLYPEEALPKTLVRLPEFAPPSLQELCRSLIRTILREQVENENPILKEKRKNNPRSVDASLVRRIVIPLIDPSDSASSSQSDSDDDAEDIGQRLAMDADLRSRATAFVENLNRMHDSIQRMPDLTEIVAGPSDWLSNGTNEGGQPSSGPRITHRLLELSDSEVSSDDEMTGEDADGAAKTAKRKRSDSDGEQRESKSRKWSVGHPTLKLQNGTATLIWKQVTPQKDRKPKEESQEKEDNYKTLMLKKILLLPLPPLLRKYINYRRTNI